MFQSLTITNHYAKLTDWIQNNLYHIHKELIHKCTNTVIPLPLLKGDDESVINMNLQ